MGFITEERELTDDRPGLGRSRRSLNDDAEITLGTRSLLGIFFGLVLICGIFFGLGYSVGRSGGAKAAAQDENGSQKALGDANLKKPSAQQQDLTPAPESVPVPASSAPEQASTSQQSSAPSQPVAAAPAPSPATAAPVTPAPQPQPAAATSTPAPARPAPAIPAPVTASTQPVTASTPGTSTFVVQIAAVRLQQDATVLVTALQKRGYNVAVRNEAQDTLLHVQIGPFSTRAQAYDMRSRLLADGYNAVVK
jgi:DedD protein